MKKRFAVGLLAQLILLTLLNYSHAEVEWDVWKTFETEETPLDVAATANRYHPGRQRSFFKQPDRQKD
jgi:hypothetical protein